MILMSLATGCGLGGADHPEETPAAHGSAGSTRMCQSPSPISGLGLSELY